MNAITRRAQMLGLAIGLVALLAIVWFRPAVAGDDGQIDAVETAERVTSGELLLVDIRTPNEWRATGIPAGAERSDWWQTGGRQRFLRDIMTFTGGARDRPIAVICARGGRSSQALRFLRSKGFSQVYDVNEGMLGSRSGPGWLARNLAVTPCPDC